MFLAAAKVGPVGRAIGIDMTHEMIERTRASAPRGSTEDPFTTSSSMLRPWTNCRCRMPQWIAWSATA